MFKTAFTMTERQHPSWTFGPVVGAVVLIPVAIWLAQPICPVTYDSFYQHFREGAAKYPSLNITDAIAEKVAVAAMMLVDQINHEDNRFRHVYKECVRDFGPADAEKWRPYTAEETCVFSLMRSAHETGA
jgi:hypothetical protein